MNRVNFASGKTKPKDNEWRSTEEEMPPKEDVYEIKFSNSNGVTEIGQSRYLPDDACRTDSEISKGIVWTGLLRKWEVTHWRMSELGDLDSRKAKNANTSPTDFVLGQTYYRKEKHPITDIPLDTPFVLVGIGDKWMDKTGVIYDMHTFKVPFDVMQAKGIRPMRCIQSSPGNLVEKYWEQRDE